MKLRTQVESILVNPREGVLDAAVRRGEELRAAGLTVLRWGLLGRQGDAVLVELAVLDRALPDAPSSEDGRGPTPSPLASSAGEPPICTAMVVPTGVGAQIGGFIADAGPFTRTVEALSDLSIVHPNVVNGGDFYAARDRTFYVDGLSLDRFFAGEVGLARRRPRRIGLLIESMAEPEVHKILNSANGVAAVYGIDIAGYAITDEPISARVTRTAQGHFQGAVDNADVLLHAVERLRAAGADAIAAVTTCGGTTAIDWTDHYLSAGVNPVGALEALISRFITRTTGLTCAHAPAYINGVGHFEGVVDPRAAAEVASGTGLPCILLGLARAPDVVPQGGVRVDDLSAIIVPFGCAGGVPAWAADRFRVPLVAVRANRCVVGVAADEIGVPVIAVDTPAEAIAYLACVRAGVAWEQLHSVPAAISQVPDLAPRARGREATPHHASGVSTLASGGAGR